MKVGEAKVILLHPVVTIGIPSCLPSSDWIKQTFTIIVTLISIYVCSINAHRISLIIILSQASYVSADLNFLNMNCSTPSVHASNTLPLLPSFFPKRRFHFYISTKSAGSLRVLMQQAEGSEAILWSRSDSTLSSWTPEHLPIGLHQQPYKVRVFEYTLSSSDSRPFY